jgi:hypothetical protein
MGKDERDKEENEVPQSPVAAFEISDLTYTAPKSSQKLCTGSFVCLVLCFTPDFILSCLGSQST